MLASPYDKEDEKKNKYVEVMLRYADVSNCDIVSIYGSKLFDDLFDGRSLI